MSTQTSNLTLMALFAILLVSCSKERYIHEPGSLVPKTVTETAGLPFITANGARLHAEAYGHPDSTLVVFLHGGPGGDYRGLLNGKQLAQHGYRVVFYDQRGSGLSERFSKESYTDKGLGALDDMYGDLAGVIAHYRSHAAQKVVLVGHSWGGILASGYAARYPGSIQGLVVAEPGGLNWADIKEYTKNTRAFSLWGEMLNDAAYLDQFLSGKKNDHAILDYKLGMLALENEITGEDNTLPASFWRAGAVVNTALFEIGNSYGPVFSTGLAAFQPPVLFLHSEYNTAYGNGWAQRVAMAYRQVTLHRITGAGHSGMLADATVWNNQVQPRLLQYLRSL